MEQKKERPGDVNKPSNKENASFVRWQGHIITELGKFVNLLLTLSIATMAFVIAKLLDEKFEFKCCSSKTLLIIGIIALLVSIISTVILSYNRLLDFRNTAKVARKRETKKINGIDELREIVKCRGRWTWRLLGLSIWSFVFGELFIIIGFAIEVFKR